MATTPNETTGIRLGLMTDVKGHIATMVYFYTDRAKRGRGTPDKPFRISLADFMDLWKADRLTFAYDSTGQRADNATAFSSSGRDPVDDGVVFNAFVVDIGTPNAIGWMQRDVPDTVKETLESGGPVRWLKQGGDLTPDPTSQSKRPRVAEDVVSIE